MAAIQHQASEVQNAFAYVQSLDQLGTSQHTREYHFSHGIARARRLLAMLGGAPRATTTCALVAGSKGKGSTAAMLSTILAAAGQRVGAFTGPHLHSPLERFAILSARAPRLKGDDRSISLNLMPEATFAALAERVRGAVDAWDRPDLGPPTRFEAYTAMAYRWFEEEAVDVAVMEIGIGGRLDAVNLAEPILSVITNISLEHTEILGSTLPQIAREKAGIMRAGRPAISSEQVPEVRRALCAEAERIGATLTFADDVCRVEQLSIQLAPSAPVSGQWIRFCRRGPPVVDADADGPMLLALHGHYQMQNAATARVAAEELGQLGFALPPGAIRAGLRQVSWPGRFEVLGWDPLVIADGAHTPHSVRQLCASLECYFGGRRIHFIVGILRDKDARGMLAAIDGAAASAVLCDMPIRRAMPAERLSALWNELAPSRAIPTTAASLSEAVAAARGRARGDDVICITGSLHLVAEAEALLNARGPA